MKKTVLMSLTTTAAVILIYACCKRISPDSTTDANPALNDPDKFAWELFIQISKPADKKMPDKSTVWETWALARNVFKDPNQLMSWEEAGKSDSTVKGLDLQPLQQQMIAKLIKKDDVMGFDGGEPSPRIGGLAETRFNKPVYDFISLNDLYYQEGIEKYISNKNTLDLPISAVEIKAIWDSIKPENKDRYHYVVLTDGAGRKKYWGLTGLHVISKTIPQWLWATFEHIDNPRLPEVDRIESLKSRDNFGRVNGKVSKELEGLFVKNNMPGVWRNYILRGTQTNFTATNGTINLLANTRIENFFVYSSSCITCHSRATIGSTLAFTDLPQPTQDSIKSAHNPKEKLAAQNYFNALGLVEKVLPNPDPISGENLIAFTGFPKPEWYEHTYPSGKKDTFKQLSFMWSFTRALRRTPYKAE